MLICVSQSQKRAETYSHMIMTPVRLCLQLISVARTHTGLHSSNVTARRSFLLYRISITTAWVAQREKERERELHRVSVPHSADGESGSAIVWGLVWVTRMIVAELDEGLRIVMCRTLSKWKQRLESSYLSTWWETNIFFCVIVCVCVRACCRTCEVI